MAAYTVLTPEESIMGVIAPGRKKSGKECPFLLENECLLQGDAMAARNRSRKKNKTGKGVLRWDRVGKCAFDSSATRRMTFEISVRHMWRPVKIRKRNAGKEQQSVLSVYAPTLPLSPVCFGCLHCSITKPAGLFGKKMGS